MQHISFHSFYIIAHSIALCLALLKYDFINVEILLFKYKTRRKVIKLTKKAIPSQSLISLSTVSNLK